MGMAAVAAPSTFTVTGTALAAAVTAGRGAVTAAVPAGVAVPAAMATGISIPAAVATATAVAATVAAAAATTTTAALRGGDVVAEGQTALPELHGLAHPQGADQQDQGRPSVDNEAGSALHGRYSGENSPAF
jgi:hypothetical protein